MFTFACALIFTVLTAFPCVNCVEHKHKHGEESFDPFHEISEVFGLKEGQNISSSNLSSMIEELFVHKFQCTDKQIAPFSCMKCLSAAQIFKIIELPPEKGLAEEGYEKASVVITAYLLDLINRCKSGGDASATAYEKYVESFRTLMKVEDYSGLVESMIARFNRTYNPKDDHHTPHNEQHKEHEDNEHGGHKDNAVDKCLNDDRFISRMNVSKNANLTSELVEKTSAAFVYYLLQGYELKQICTELPKKDDFINDVFSVLGVTGTALSEAKFIELLKKLKIGKTASTEESHDGHDHRRRKRSIDRSLDDAAWMDRILMTMNRREREESMTALSLQRRALQQVSVKRCLNVHQLMIAHSIKESEGISKTKFSDVCPALIQQQISGACSPNETTTPPSPARYSTAESFGYGTLMVLLISTLAVLGAVLVPFLNTGLYNNLIVVFIALAVATLTGDALLHLIPQALGLHDHSDGKGHEGEGLVPDFVWKQLALIGSMYFFFLVECIMNLQKKPTDDDESDQNGHGHSHSLPVKKPTKEKPPNNHVGNGSHGNVSLTDVKSLDTGGTVVGIDNPAFATSLADMADVSENYNHSNVRRLSEVTHLDKDDDKKKWRLKDIRSVAIMILLGDSLHNFIDGIAIGAAFAQDLNSGVSTSIAVLCHELPHELGDFAALLASGMPVKYALFLNFLSACCAFLGLYIGLGIAVDMAVRRWIFALTGGMFIYVGLVSMVPELMRMRTSSRFRTFILQNVGLIAGYGIMLLIAVFEDKITIV